MVDWISCAHRSPHDWYLAVDSPVGVSCFLPTTRLSRYSEFYWHCLAIDPRFPWPHFIAVGPLLGHLLLLFFFAFLLVTDMHFEGSLPLRYTFVLVQICIHLIGTWHFSSGFTWWTWVCPCKAFHWHRVPLSVIASFTHGGQTPYLAILFNTEFDQPFRNLCCGISFCDDPLCPWGLSKTSQMLPRLWISHLFPTWGPNWFFSGLFFRIPVQVPPTDMLLFLTAEEMFFS